MWKPQPSLEATAIDSILQESRSRDQASIKRITAEGSETKTAVSLSGVTSRNSEGEHHYWASKSAPPHFHFSKKLSLHGNVRKEQRRKRWVFQWWIKGRKETQEIQICRKSMLCHGHQVHSNVCLLFQLLPLHTFPSNSRGQGRELTVQGAAGHPDRCAILKPL